MAFTTEEIDAAMRVYLGGPVEEGAIQIGGKEERLAQRYPEDFLSLKTSLDQMLDSATTWAKNKSADDQDTIHSWLNKKLPSLSVVSRAKVAAHVLYRMEQ